jgi:flagellar biogenesis protein FliO
MLRSLSFAALSLSCAFITGPLAAEPAATTAPPAWQDGASVYLNMAEENLGGDKNASPPSPANEDASIAPMFLAESAPALNSAVLPTVHSAPLESDVTADRRRLAPPSNPAFTMVAKPSPESEPGNKKPGGAVSFGLPLDSLYTMLSALAIVIGAFLLCAWLLKRGAARKATAALPADVVSVLGRVPLAARQFADLLRVGNKLVLITLTPAGASTLTEVTDPLEVDRLVGLCQQSDPHSTTKAFEQVFRQMSLEPARGGFLGNESPLPSLQSTIESFRAQQGAAARA